TSSSIKPPNWSESIVVTVLMMGASWHSGSSTAMRYDDSVRPSWDVKSSCPFGGIRYTIRNGTGRSMISTPLHGSGIFNGSPFFSLSAMRLVIFFSSLVIGFRIDLFQFAQEAGQ